MPWYIVAKSPAALSDIRSLLSNFWYLIVVGLLLFVAILALRVSSRLSLMLNGLVKSEKQRETASESESGFSNYDGLPV